VQRRRGGGARDGTRVCAARDVVADVLPRRRHRRRVARRRDLADRLRELDLKFNHITAAGVRSLLSSTRLTALAQLQLTHNEIEDEIVDVLATCPQVARLASLTLDDTYLSDEARAALQALPLPAGVLDLWLLREGI
jgi:hypothetical protein